MLAFMGSPSTLLYTVGSANTDAVDLGVRPFDAYGNPLCAVVDEIADRAAGQAPRSRSSGRQHTLPKACTDMVRQDRISVVSVTCATSVLHAFDRLPRRQSEHAEAGRFISSVSCY